MKYKRGNKNVKDLNRDELEDTINHIISRVTLEHDFRDFIILDWIRGMLETRGLIEGVDEDENQSE